MSADRFDDDDEQNDDYFSEVDEGGDTGLSPKFVKLADTVRSFKEILEGRHDELPEQAFYMVGSIEEAVAKAKKL